MSNKRNENEFDHYDDINERKYVQLFLYSDWLSRY